MPQEIKDHTFPQWALRGVKREQSSDGPVSDNLQIYEHTDLELFRIAMAMAMTQTVQVAAMGPTKQEKAQVRRLFSWSYPISYSLH